MSEYASIKKTLRGNSLVLGDLRDDDALSVFVVRAAVPKGRLRGVTLPELPEDVHVVRAKDIPGKNAVTVEDVEIPVLASEEIRFSGEPILLLAGRDPETLEALAENIVIDCEAEEPFFAFEEGREDRTVLRREAKRGDTEAAFARAEKVITERFSTGLQEHLYSESHGAYVAWGNDVSTLAVTSSTQWPHHVHKTLAEVLAVPRDLVSVSVPQEPDLALDGKLWYPSLVAAHAGLVAWLTKKNVKLLSGREEDFLFTPKRAPVALAYRAGLDEEGYLVALDAEIFINFGAYPAFVREILDRAVFGALAGYCCPNFRVRATAVRTDLPPLGPFSGMGEAASLFALETLTEKLRELAEENPLVWKKKNLLIKGKAGIVGEPAKHLIPDPAVLDRAAALSDFSRKHAVFELAKKRRLQGLSVIEGRRGIGLALGCQGSCFLGDGEEKEGSSVELFLDTEGEVSLSAAAIPGSYTLHEIWTKMIRESLGVEKVTIKPVRTLEIRDSGPSTLSRNITLMTDLIEECCQLIKKKRFRSPLPLHASKTFHPSRGIAWDEERFTGNAFYALAWAAAVVEIQYDSLGISPEIRGLWLVADGGRLLDEAEAKRTLERGLGQALGWSTREKLFFENGRIPISQIASYRIPSTLEIPAPRIEFLDADARKPSKGIGDLALSCVPAAYAAALNQATGKLPTSIPISFDFAVSAEEEKA